MGYDKAPDILLQKTLKGFVPYGHHSGAMLGDLVIGQVITCKPRKNRKPERNSAYWAGLHPAIQNADAWPTTKHLHDDLKRLTGYVETYFDPLSGQQVVVPQSTAFDKMSEHEFAAFFKLAQLKFTSIMGFDPWAHRGDAA